jgi:hypothetical protein
VAALPSAASCLQGAQQHGSGVGCGTLPHAAAQPHVMFVMLLLAGTHTPTHQHTTRPPAAAACRLLLLLLARRRPGLLCELRQEPEADRGVRARAGQQLVMPGAVAAAPHPVAVP